MDNTLFDCREEIKRLEAEAAALREALGDLLAMLGEDEEEPCPDWRAIRDVAIATFVSADAGRLMLERLRLAEAERDDLRARLLALAEMSRVPREKRWQQ